MKRALIIGSSGGIGSALMSGLTHAGWQADGLSRRDHGFEITDPDNVNAHLSDLSGPYDLIFIATGALVIDGNGPEKSIRSLNHDAMALQFAVNAIGPALILKHVARLLPKDRPACVAALSAKVGSIGDNALGGWTSYRASKAALNQIIKTTSVELARSHPKAACIALHPGTVETEFTRAYLGRHPSVPASVAAERLIEVLDKIKPADTGGFYSYSGEALPW